MALRKFDQPPPPQEKHTYIRFRETNGYMYWDAIDPTNADKNQVVCRIGPSGNLQLFYIAKRDLVPDLDLTEAGFIKVFHEGCGTELT